MKNNKRNLICAIFYTIAGIFFILDGILRTATLSKVLCGVGGLLFLFAGIGSFYIYFKNKNSENT